jgi:hypothetical protein
MFSYSEIDKKSLLLDPKNGDRDNISVKNDFVIFKSSHLLSMYDNSKSFINLNLFCEITELVESDYSFDVKYRIKKILSNNFGKTENGGQDIFINHFEFLKRFYNSSTVMPLFISPNDEKYPSIGKKGEYYLIEEKTKTILKDPNETFDLSTFKWIETFVYEGITFSLTISISNNHSENEIYLDAINVDGSLSTSTQSVSYINNWLKIENVTVDRSKSTYNHLMLKHSPVDMLEIREGNNDSSNSYYGISLFGLNKKIGESVFAMLPSNDFMKLVNENESTNKIEFVGLNK